MRTSIISVVALLFVIVVLAAGWPRNRTPRPAAPGGETANLKVGGMVCGACALRVEKIATRLDGVTHATVDREQGRVHVVYDAARTGPVAIARAVAEAGFQADVFQ